MLDYSKKKILYIVTKSVWGGAQKYTYDLTVSLKCEGYEAEVVSGGNGPLASKTRAQNIPYWEIKNFGRDIRILKDLFSFFEIARLIDRNRPDIIHVSSSKAGGLVGLVLFFLKLRSTHYAPRSIFTVHGWAFHEDRPIWQIWLIKLASRLTCFFYDKIICVSEFDYNSAIKNHIVSKKKLVLIHNGIDIPNYNFLDRDEARKNIMEKTDNHGIRKDSFWIGLIAEYTKNKGQKYLMEAFHAFQETSAQLILIGYGEDKFKLKSEISDLKLTNSVFLVDNFPNAFLCLKAFDIFAMSSVKEGLPYALLEAGLAGVPVVASNVGGIPEIIEDKKTGLLVEPKNPLALKKAVEEISENKEKRENFGQNARERIISAFSLEKMVKKTKEAYGLL